MMKHQGQWAADENQPASEIEQQYTEQERRGASGGRRIIQFSLELLHVDGSLLWLVVDPMQLVDCYSQ